MTRRITVAALLAVISSVAGSQVRHEETLAGLGFPNGLAMLNPTQSRDIFYHGTGGVDASEGRLHLDLLLAVHDFRYAFVQVLVNDVPRLSRTLTAQDATIPVDLDLAPGELSQSFIKVTLRFGGRLTDDRCYDWRSNGSYITVGPASGIRYAYQPERVTTIAGAWSVLPRRVAVQIPSGALTPSLYRAAWQVGTALLRAGHTITYASASAIAADSNGVVIVAARDQRAADLMLDRVNGQPTLVVSDTFPAAQLLGESWRHVAQGADVRVTASRTERDAAFSSSTITFQQLGLGSVQRDFGERADWSFPFSVRDLSPGMIPARIGLDVVAGLSPDAQGTVGQVFINDVLVRSTPINDAGKSQRITVDVPRGLLGVDNTLRFVLQRKAPNSLSPATGECRALPAPVAAQVLETSIIEGAKIDHLTEFLELPALLRTGFDVYLPKGVLSDPNGTLPFLARLGADVLPMADAGTLTFYDGKQPPSPKRLFVALGTTDGMDADGPAQLDHGRLVIDGPKTQPVLDVSGRLNSAVIQIASIGDQRGLVILPLASGALPTPASIALSRGDLAFASTDGVDLVVNRRGPSSAARLFSGRLARYRYWMYAFLALFAAIGIVYLLRRLRGQRSRRSVNAALASSR